ncbi:hypothetical protein [Aestuariispira ectoiniformans]|uniref:hypothetical protein n=1 Tax=Aestuariispira ectoiniformans TaxID=2775080 RepID=UPI00223A975C|nr:hypothetical protein [Aestuariispira ectoiniformans]
MQEIRFAVWQFVRLMVRLEDSVKTEKSDALKALYNGWEDIWVDLDAQLVDLSKQDPDAFADLMMDQEVICDDVSKEECLLVAGELNKVITEIKGLLAKTEDDEMVEDLSFERDELIELEREIRKMAA